MLSLAYLLLHLLGRKIFTQPDAYCLTDYCPNNMVTLLPLRREPLL